MSQPTSQEDLLDRMEVPTRVRCYNGAFDSGYTRAMQAQDKVLALIRQYVPEAACTYFPAEGTYCVHVWGKALSGEQHHATRAGALRAALQHVQENATT